MNGALNINRGDAEARGVNDLTGGVSFNVSVLKQGVKRMVNGFQKPPRLGASAVKLNAHV